MAIANTSLRVAELNFNQLKSNFKQFISNKTEFTDHNFDGSVLSHVLDILTYNTYYNAFYLNMIANEMFLDSTTTKASAFSLSKMLNYLPRSARSAYAEITLSFSPNDAPSEIIIPKYSRFQTTINGVQYEFVTSENISVFNENGTYRKTIGIYEGIVLTYTFTYEAGAKAYFEIPVENLDTSSLVVEVKPNSTSTTKTIYSRVSDITTVKATSTVYYLQKTADGYYEIYFGDGVLGKALEAGNVVAVTFRATEGSTPNGASTFTPVGYSGYNKGNSTVLYQATIVSVDQVAKEGQDEETLDSIKFNAPRSYERQNRLISETDFKNYLLENYSDIQAVNVWGGEKHPTPLYGKAIISIKPFNGYVITNQRKNQIINDVLKYSAMSIDPQIIDPAFLFIRPTITAFYNSTTTTLSAQDLFGKVSTAVLNYESKSLGVFGSRFRLSRLTAAIDSAHASIESNDTDILMEKRFTPVLNSKLSYQVRFQNELHHPYEGFLGTITSTGFTISGNDNTLFVDDDGKGKLRLYYLSLGNKVYVNTNAGTVNYTTGLVTLTSIIFNSYIGDELSIFAMPASTDIFTSQNQIILFAYPKVSLYDTNQQRVIYTSTVTATGNETLVRTDAILNTVTL